MVHHGPPRSTEVHRGLPRSTEVHRGPSAVSNHFLSPPGSSGSCPIPACPSCLRRKPRTRRTALRLVTAALCTSATCRSPSSPAASNRSRWTLGTRPRGLQVQVCPRPRSATSKSNRSRETSASNRVSGTLPRLVEVAEGKEIHVSDRVFQRFKPASRRSASLRHCSRRTEPVSFTVLVFLSSAPSPALNRTSPSAGFGYDREPRLFFDDTCVVPDRLEGETLVQDLRVTAARWGAAEGSSRSRSRQMA